MEQFMGKNPWEFGARAIERDAALPQECAAMRGGAVTVAKAFCELDANGRAG